MMSKALRTKLGLGLSGVLIAVLFEAPALAEPKEFDWKEFATEDSAMANIAVTLVTGLVNAMGRLIEASSSALTGPMVNLAGAVMFPWLLLELLKMMSITHDQNPATIIARIFNRLMLFVFLLALTLGNGVSFISNQIVVPIFSGIVKLGNELNSQLWSGYGSGQSCSVSGNSMLGDFSGLQSGGAYADLANSINSAICQLTGTFYKGIGAGIYIISESFWIDGVVPQISFIALFAGLFITAIYAFLFLRLPLVFADALIKFAINLMLLPVLIMAYLFQPTRGVVKQAITSSLAAALSVFFTVVLGGVCLALLNGVIDFIEARQESVAGAAPGIFSAFNATEGVTIILVGLMTNAIIRSAPKIAAELVGFTGDMGGAGSAAGGAIKGAAMASVGVVAAGAGAVFAKGAMASAVANGVTKSTSFADPKQK